MASEDPLLPDKLKKKEFTDHERAIVNRCLDAVEARGHYLQAKGLTQTNFVLGVANTLLIAWSFGAIPEHFWIVYLIEVLFLFPVRWMHQVSAVPLKQHAYWLDFCWIANFLAVLVLVVDCTAGNLLGSSIRTSLLSAFWGVACGPLLLATGFLGNALLFHDADNVASVLIHLFPSLLMYTLMWEHERVNEAWPRLFTVDLREVSPRKIYTDAGLAYAVWFVGYTMWLLSYGMSMPQIGHDTIFHANMRGGFGREVAKVLCRPRDEHDQMVRTNEFPRSYAVAYMLGHALAVHVAILVSLVCLESKFLHIGICGVMVGLTIKNAASRYTFYIVNSYGVVLRQELGIPLNRKASALV